MRTQVLVFYYVKIVR